MVSFIEDYRAEYGVEPICAMLPIAPSTYYACNARERDQERLPHGPSATLGCASKSIESGKRTSEFKECARCGDS